MVLTDEQIEQWIDTCNHQPAKHVLRDELNSDNGWKANVEYLLKNCPHTVRVCEGGGPEDLIKSLVLTFIKMQFALEKK